MYKILEPITYRQKLLYKFIDKTCDQPIPSHTCEAQKCGAYKSKRGCIALLEYFEYCDSIRITYFPLTSPIYYWRCCGKRGYKHPLPYCHPKPPDNCHII